MIFFTSDHHFGHTNVIKESNRSFATVEEMDAEMVKRWNDRVSDVDIVYHLGDFSLENRVKVKDYFAQLRGKIRILGNPWHKDGAWLENSWGDCHDLVSLSGHPVEILPPIYVIEGSTWGECDDLISTREHHIHILHPIPMIEVESPIILCHYPFVEWDRQFYGSWHLYGHCHGEYKSNGKVLDVGVDCWDFYPVSLDTLATIMKDR